MTSSTWCPCGAAANHDIDVVGQLLVEPYVRDAVLINEARWRLVS